MFSFASLNWGNFDIDLKKHTCKAMIDLIKKNEADYFKRDLNMKIAQGILKHNKGIKLKTAMDKVNENINQQADLASTAHFIPRRSENKYIMNDL